MELWSNRSVEWGLRALQLIFAIIVMGTTAYAIHMYHGRTVEVETDFGDFTAWQGVPNSWGFLMFCAVWSLLGVAFICVASRLRDRVWIRFSCLAVEVVALLSWLAGFIAVAVSVGSGTCPAEEKHCGSIAAAATFGALEFVLFAVTAMLTWKLVLGVPRWKGPAPNKSQTGNGIPL